MKDFHSRAINCAINYFSVSALGGIICGINYFGAGFSDAVHPDPLWIKGVIAAMWGLQPLATLFEYVALRDSWKGANVFLLCALGALWSVCVGYGYVWAMRKWRR